MAEIRKQGNVVLASNSHKGVSVSQETEAEFYLFT